MKNPELTRVRAALSALPKEAREKIPDWKHEHPLIYLQEIGPQVFIYKPLTLKEMRKTIALSHPELTPDYISPDRLRLKGSSREVALENLVGRATPRNPMLLLAQEYMFSRCILYPENYKPVSNEPAYISNSIVRCIWDISIFASNDDMEEAILAARQLVGIELGMELSTYVSGCLGIPIKEVEELSAAELAKYVAVAERISGKPLEIEAQATQKKVKPTQEQRELSQMQASPRRQSRKKEKLMAVNENLEFVGPAGNDAPKGVIDIDQENKALNDLMKKDN